VGSGTIWEKWDKLRQKLQSIKENYIGWVMCYARKTPGKRAVTWTADKRSSTLLHLGGYGLDTYQTDG